MSDFKTDVSLAKKGDADAFARLYSAVYKDLYRVALYCLKNAHDACDAVSDTVVDAFTSVCRLRNENAFRQWMMKILQAKIKRRLCEYMHKHVEYDESCFDGIDFDFDTFELKESLLRLDDQSRSILSLSVLCGYTSSEISKICGIPPATVRTKLSRIKEKLRLELSAEC